MSAYKDKTQGTWYVSFRYIDWTGKKTQKLKREFKTKKEGTQECQVSVSGIDWETDGASESG